MPLRTATRVLEVPTQANPGASFYGRDGAPITYKAWVCTNPDCGFSIRIDKGEVTYGKRIEPKH